MPRRRSVTAVRPLSLLAAGAIMASCHADREVEIFTDPRDGMEYVTVELGGSRWLAENLRFDAREGSRCLADLPEHCAEYGRLYTWPVAASACPAGWRLATENDWRALELFLGMSEAEVPQERYRGRDEGARLRVNGGSGFDVKLGGYMRPDGTPRRLHERAAFWTATQYEVGETSWHRDIGTDPRIYRSPVDHGYYLSVRCVSGNDASEGPAL